MEMFPYDMDNTFTRGDLKGSSGKLGKYCWRKPECASAQQAAIEQVVSRIDTEDFLAWYDAVDALTADAARTDPKNQCPAGELQNIRQGVRDWITTRNEIFPATWGQETD